MMHFLCYFYKEEFVYKKKCGHGLVLIYVTSGAKYHFITKNSIFGTKERISNFKIWVYLIDFVLLIKCIRMGLHV